MLMELEKGDTLLLKDGRVVRVLSIYKPAGEIVRADVLDDTKDSPTREAVFVKDFAKILKKAIKPEAQEQALPPEQSVKSKEPVSEAIKDDVKTREKHTTSAAATHKRAQAEVKGAK